MSRALDRALEFLNRVCAELGLDDDETDVADPLASDDEVNDETVIW